MGRIALSVSTLMICVHWKELTFLLAVPFVSVLPRAYNGIGLVKLIELSRIDTNIMVVRVLIIRPATIQRNSGNSDAKHTDTMGATLDKECVHDVCACPPTSAQRGTDEKGGISVGNITGHCYIKHKTARMRSFAATK